MPNENISIDESKGEVICPKCNGERFFITENLMAEYKVDVKLCDRCHGDGKLDWVENAVGKNKQKYRGRKFTKLYSPF